MRDKLVRRVKNENWEKGGTKLSPMVHTVLTVCTASYLVVEKYWIHNYTPFGQITKCSRSQARQGYTISMFGERAFVSVDCWYDKLFFIPSLAPFFAPCCRN